MPVHVFAVAAKTGGQVLGAFEGEVQIGFALAFAAFAEDRRYLHSHMVAVLPEFQNRSVGRQLKLAQREDAIGRGIDLIQWTFDPLEIRNAYFNIARLGVVIRRYLIDVYGTSSSPLHRSLPTDRLLAEWWLKSSRVGAALQNNPRAPSPTAEHILVPDLSVELDNAAVIQADVRQEFLRWFNQDYAVTGFTVAQPSGVYLLEPHEN